MLIRATLSPDHWLALLCSLSSLLDSANDVNLEFMDGDKAEMRFTKFVAQQRVKQARAKCGKWLQDIA